MNVLGHPYASFIVLMYETAKYGQSITAGFIDQFGGKRLMANHYVVLCIDVATDSSRIQF